MSIVVQLALAVGRAVRPAEAGVLAAEAADAGVAAIRLRDDGSLEPTVVASYLAGRPGRIGYLAEVRTTHNAPYNVARRVLSLDRATGGRAGIALLPGGGDEVSEASVPDPSATGPARRWSEYASVLTRLWESFPREALLGDQEAALVADDSLIRPIAHEGAFYRVAGPLDGPSSAQGRPVVLADLDALPPAAVAASADVVVADLAATAGADTALTAALEQAGRSRGSVALLGRVQVGAADSAADLLAWARRHRLDGLELVPAGDPHAVLTGLVPGLVDAAAARSAPTLRAALGLREPVAVLS